MKLECSTEEAVALVNLLGQMPTSAGVFELWGNFRDQVIAQTQADASAKQAEPAAPAEDIPS